MRVAVHNGDFHADDVLSVHVLRKLFDFELIRTRDEETLELCDMLIDVGMIYDPSIGRFDHHQNDSPVRKNGIPYATIGLLWKKLGEKICGSWKVARLIDRKIIQWIDAHDNGIEVNKSEFGFAYTLATAIASFNPVWNSRETYDDQFEVAVKWAGELFDREIEKAKGLVKGERFVEREIQNQLDKEIILLTLPAPWMKTVIIKCPNAKFVVFPNENGEGYIVQSVPVQIGSFDYNRKLKTEWRAKDAEEINKLVGIEDAIFCHATGFCGGARSRASAIKMAEMSL